MPHHRLLLCVCVCVWQVPLPGATLCEVARKTVGRSIDLQKHGEWGKQICIPDKCLFQGGQLAFPSLMERAWFPRGCAPVGAQLILLLHLGGWWWSCLGSGERAVDISHNPHPCLHVSVSGSPLSSHGGGRGQRLTGICRMGRLVHLILESLPCRGDRGSF